MHDAILAQLITLSHNLADPALDYVILSEGNTSARAAADTFWVKASGTELRTIKREGFVRVSFERVLNILDDPDLDDEAVKQRLDATRVDPESTGGVRPSVETVLHAICLGLEGVSFVGHTHPTAINALTCSAAFETAVSGRLFPDEIVICEVPKVILMQNHGLIALGRSADQVENITAMAVKTARVLMGTYALGGPHFMTPQAVERIHTRPDEAYRRKLLGE
jgi:rhamnose utilization protein RhaD (predicted bifunctional aldolase and dehydrogenase)